MKPLKIELVGPVHPYRGGIAHFNEALYRSFKQQGHDVHAVSFSMQYPGVLFPGKSQYDNEEPENPVAQERIINTMWPISWKKAGRKIARRKPDLVIFRFWLPALGLTLGRVARTIKKRSPHTVIIGLTDNIASHERHMGGKWLTRYFVRSCQGFLAMSQAVMQDLNGFTSNPFKVLSPHPVYDIFGKAIDKAKAREQLNIPQGQNVVLFFGVVRKYKGLDMLIRALARPECHALDLHLIVCGEFYQDPRPYKELIKTNGLQHHVTLVNRYVSFKEVAQYFCATDIVAQTYRSATQSGVTQIAYHFGRPILITNVGGLSEIVKNGESGYVTRPDPKAVAEGLSDFYNHRREEDMALAIKKDRKRYTWKAMVERFETLYSAIKNDDSEALHNG